MKWCCTRNSSQAIFLHIRIYHCCVQPVYPKVKLWLHYLALCEKHGGKKWQTISSLLSCNLSDAYSIIQARIYYLLLLFLTLSSPFLPNNSCWCVETMNKFLHAPARHIQPPLAPPTLLPETIIHPLWSFWTRKNSPPTKPLAKMLVAQVLP